ncbi:hypothetical protein F5144DRAFT_323851 [Chaetomium tenue]|uniref:Uncharacterized protein n=1 Tax=Chaetomium tenue TaxID=1854479 RepID=A0ACB7P4A6_9PEZI|nr:hypothetical protein F5144DRAFT_323851 [Chaetomium globosum]
MIPNSFHLTRRFSVLIVLGPAGSGSVPRIHREPTNCLHFEAIEPLVISMTSREDSYPSYFPNIEHRHGQSRTPLTTRLLVVKRGSCQLGGSARQHEMRQSSR